MTSPKGERHEWSIQLANFLRDRVSTEGGRALAFLPKDRSHNLDPDEWLDIRPSALSNESFERRVVARFLGSGRSHVLICDEMTSAPDLVSDRLNQLPINIQYVRDDEAAFGIVRTGDSDVLTDQEVLSGLSWISSGYPSVGIGGDQDFERICDSALDSGWLRLDDQAELAKHTEAILFRAYHLSNFIIWT